MITYKPEGDHSWEDDWEYYEDSNIAELEKKMSMDLHYYKYGHLES
jgi:hypothetical protein